MAKLMYKPVGILSGILAGLLGKRLFELVWARFPYDDPAKPDQRDATWGEVLVAAGLQGVVYALVRAVVQRGGAKAFHRSTGAWPGDETYEG